MQIKEIIESAEISIEAIRWRPQCKQVLTSLFAQKYPGTELYFANNSNMGTLFVTTDKNNIRKKDVMSYYSEPTEHFNASIYGPQLEEDDDGTRYVGYGFDAIDSGRFKGIVMPFLQTVVPPLATRFNAEPAIMIMVEDQSAGAWQGIANKLGWHYFNPG